MKKKALSFALALVMCLGLTVPAMAAGYTEVVPCKYEQVGNFSDGLAAVAIRAGTDKYGDGIYSWGFIDKAGNEVIPCQYVCPAGKYPEDNPRFSEGLAAVVGENDKWGYIDKTGKVVIPFQYDSALHFSEGLALVGLKNGKPKDIFGHYPCDFGYIDKVGNVVVPIKYGIYGGIDGASNFSEGLAAVGLNGEVLYLDKTGKVVFSDHGKYSMVEGFSEGLAAVQDGNGKWGFIDKTGNEVVPCKYEQVGNFSEGLASVYVGEFPKGHVGFIDKTGKMVIPAEYKNSSGTGITCTFSEGLASMYGYGFIDKTGKEVIHRNYNTAGDFSEGLAVKNYGGKYGYIDKTGKEVVPCQYAWACSFSDGMAAVAIKDSDSAPGSGWKALRWGFVCLGDVPVVEHEKPTKPEKPTVAADSDLVIVDGILTKYVGPGGDVVLPSGVTSIGSGAFELCWKLTSVTIPDSVTSIGNQAFSKCGGLKSVTIPNSVTSIGVEAFSGCTNLTSVTIGNGVTSIGNYAFRNCESLKSVTIGNGVTSIGNEAFRGCGLTSVTIPNSVTSIGTSVFYGCKGLISVTIGSGMTTTGRDTFSGCSGLKSVVIPSNVTNIERTAFNWCQGLTSVTIPASVTSIGQMAFNFCDSLKDVYYSGTEAQWKAIQIEDFNSSLTSAAIHYNSPMPAPAEPTVGNFTDVKASDYFADPVAWAVEKGVTAGTSATTFSPNATCTQGQILTFLWRAKSEPKPTGTVSGTQYYAAAAQWAKEQGLTDSFSAEADCTRAMVVTYLWKLAGSPKAGMSKFSDVSANAAYAQAVAWAVEQGITSGTSATTFSPDATCTRGQIVTFLYRAFAK